MEECEKKKENWFAIERSHFFAELHSRKKTRQRASSIGSREEGLSIRKKTQTLAINNMRPQPFGRDGEKRVPPPPGEVVNQINSRKETKVSLSDIFNQTRVGGGH